MCVGVLMHTSTSSRCSMEAAQSSRPKRRRPPNFGATIPKITTRGLVTESDTSIPDNIADREDCPLCKKFGSGPCGEIFKQWLACTDKHPGKDASGEPIHLSKCTDLAENLAECLDENTEYYTDNDNNNQDQDANTAEKDRELKDAWREFVNDMEDGIASGKYNVLPFPGKINPKIEVRLATETGAAFFVPEKDGQPIVAAYILDDNGNVIAAGSRDDMDMEGLGCVLQFKVLHDMKSATGRAIYDNENDDVAIFSRTMLLPGK
eukprot:CAMPEP_0172317570 /NCGR_PEP_ID=MMETSP1058-20130122/32021_1 /TAXON_ID=83371 /ORGANISM="Detonula confervacea, Strain CCMP 353" /LENGTH=263 /DNA_ID=CAMNT_0013032161 /DNA_START=244 /DNA_END=1035 /DNA_ORIENTATION=-